MKLKDLLNEIADYRDRMITDIIQAVFKEIDPIPFPMWMEEEDKQAVVTLLRAYKSKYKDNIPNLLNKDALNRTQPELYRRLKSLISKPEDR